jgi:hypothetical protein
MIRAFSARPSAVETLVQQSGLRRVLARFDLAGLRPVPSSVSPDLGKQGW